MDKNTVKKITYLLFHSMATFRKQFREQFIYKGSNESKCNKNQNAAIVSIAKLGKMTSTNLGKILDMKKGSITTLVDSLEEMNFLKKETDSKDRRKVLLNLTEKGKKRFDVIEESVFCSVDNIFKNLDENDVETLLYNLQSVFNILQKIDCNYKEE